MMTIKAITQEAKATKKKSEIINKMGNSFFKRNTIFVRSIIFVFILDPSCYFKNMKIITAIGKKRSIALTEIGISLSFVIFVIIPPILRGASIHKRRSSARITDALGNLIIYKSFLNEDFMPLVFKLFLCFFFDL